MSNIHWICADTKNGTIEQTEAYNILLGQGYVVVKREQRYGHKWALMLKNDDRGTTGYEDAIILKGAKP